MVVPSCWDWLRSEPVDAAQDVGEQIAGYRDFGHLERDIAPLAHHLRADLDQLLAQRGQRPILYLLLQSQRPLVAISGPSGRKASMSAYDPKRTFSALRLERP